MAEARSLIHAIVLGLSGTGDSIRHANNGGESAGRRRSRARLDRFLVTESRLAQVHMHVDQAGRNDQTFARRSLQFRISAAAITSADFGFRADDFSIGDVKIGDFIPLDLRDRSRDRCE